jgi:hypothetical protein
MLNETIDILLGCIHERVTAEYLPLVDAFFVPSAVGVVLIFVCVFVIAMIHAFTALVAHDTKK